MKMTDRLWYRDDDQATTRPFHVSGSNHPHLAPCGRVTAGPPVLYRNIGNGDDVCVRCAGWMLAQGDRRPGSPFTDH